MSAQGISSDFIKSETINLLLKLLEALSYHISIDVSLGDDHEFKIDPRISWDDVEELDGKLRELYSPLTRCPSCGLEVVMRCGNGCASSASR